MPKYQTILILEKYLIEHIYCFFLIDGQLGVGVGQFGFGVDTLLQVVEHFIVFDWFRVALFQHREFAEFIVVLYYSQVGQLEIYFDCIFAIIELVINLAKYFQTIFFELLSIFFKLNLRNGGVE